MPPDQGLLRIANPINAEVVITHQLSGYREQPHDAVRNRVLLSDRCTLLTNCVNNVIIHSDVAMTPQLYAPRHIKPYNPLNSLTLSTKSEVPSAIGCLEGFQLCVPEEPILLIEVLDRFEVHPTAWGHLDVRDSVVLGIPPISKLICGLASKDARQLSFPGLIFITNRISGRFMDSIEAVTLGDGPQNSIRFGGFARNRGHFFTQSVRQIFKCPMRRPLLKPPSHVKGDDVQITTGIMNKGMISKAILEGYLLQAWAPEKSILLIQVLDCFEIHSTRLKIAKLYCDQ